MTEFKYPRPWIKTLEGVRKSSISYQDKSTYEFAKDWALKAPNNPCMVLGVKGGKTVSYGQFYDAMKRLAVAMTDLGVKKGDKIAVMLPNIPQYVIAHYAILSLGGTVVQTNPLYTQRELDHIVQDSGAVGMISITQFSDKINLVLDTKGTTLKWAMYGKVADYMSPIIAFLAKITKALVEPGVPARSDNYSLPGLLKAADPSKFKEADIDFENDIALFQYTGGTTGLSKGAMLTHKNISYNAQQARETIHMVKDGQGAVLTALPLFHSFALTSCLGLALNLGIPMILVPNPREAIPHGEVHDLITKHKITFFPAVPTMLIGIANHPKAATTDWSHLIAVISGGAALPMEVAKRFTEVTHAPVVEGYGLSETSPLLTVNPIGSDTVKPVVGSIGLPAPDTEIKVVNTEDLSKELEIGEVGELAAKGPQVMKGYYNKDEENKKTFLPDGWFLTGDVAKMDEKGFFYIVDRKKDMILSTSGYNVYPREVEEVLFEHPKVLEAAVAAIQDKKGEAVGAWVVLKNGETATEEEIIAFCKENLAAYKVPKQVVFREELPKTMVGKVLRRKLQETDTE